MDIKLNWIKPNVFPIWYVENTFVSDGTPLLRIEALIMEKNNIWTMNVLGIRSVRFSADSEIEAQHYAETAFFSTLKDLKKLQKTVTK